MTNEEMVKYVISKRCVEFDYKKIDDNIFEVLIVPIVPIEKIDINIVIEKH